MSIRISRGLLIVVCLFSAASMALAEPKRGEGWLESESEIEKAVSDATHVRTRADGTSEVEYHSADGRVAYAFEGCLWSGEWWVSEERLCYRYPSLSGDMAHCFYLRDGPAGLEFWSVDDSEARQPLALVKSLLDGNPQELPLDSGGRCEET